MSGILEWRFFRSRNFCDICRKLIILIWPISCSLRCWPGVFVVSAQLGQKLRRNAWSLDWTKSVRFHSVRGSMLGIILIWYVSHFNPVSVCGLSGSPLYEVDFVLSLCHISWQTTLFHINFCWTCLIPWIMIHVHLRVLRMYVIVMRFLYTILYYGLNNAILGPYATSGLRLYNVCAVWSALLWWLLQPVQWYRITFSTLGSRC